jgi:hypothetical protein
MIAFVIVTVVKKSNPTKEETMKEEGKEEAEIRAKELGKGEKKI